MRALLFALLVALGGCMLRHSWGLTGNLTTKSGGLIRLQKEFILLNGTKVEEDESGYYTVQFAVSPPGKLAPPASQVSGYDTTATVTFKVNGQQVVRQVSVGQGTTISGVCEAIDVAVQDTTTLANVPAGLQYSVSINVVKGTRGSTAIPPTLKGIASNPLGGAGIANGGVGGQTIGVGASIDYVIPQGVGVTSCEVSTDQPVAAANNVDVTVFDNSGTIFIKAYNVNGNVLPIFVDVPANAGVVRLTGIGAIANVNLTWGIDG